MPPLPKHHTARARRNKDSTKAILIPVANRTVPTPPEETDWHPRALVWWDKAWRSPMVQEWTEADEELLLVCLAQRHAYWSAFDRDDSRVLPTLLNSIVSAEKNLGLSPMSRRSLQWQIEQAEAAEEKTVQRRRAKAVKSGPKGVVSDPRELLA